MNNATLWKHHEYLLEALSLINEAYLIASKANCSYCLCHFVCCFTETNHESKQKIRLKKMKKNAFMLVAILWYNAISFRVALQSTYIDEFGQILIVSSKSHNCSIAFMAHKMFLFSDRCSNDQMKKSVRVFASAYSASWWRWREWSAVHSPTSWWKLATPLVRQRPRLWSHPGSSLPKWVLVFLHLRPLENLLRGCIYNTPVYTS